MVYSILIIVNIKHHCHIYISKHHHVTIESQHKGCYVYKHQAAYTFSFLYCPTIALHNSCLVLSDSYIIMFHIYYWIYNPACRCYEFIFIPFDNMYGDSNFNLATFVKSIWSSVNELRKYVHFTCK